MFFFGEKIVYPDKQALCVFEKKKNYFFLKKNVFLGNFFFRKIVFKIFAYKKICQN